MTIKRILVPILSADLDRPTLQTALAVARQFGSHLEALYEPRSAEHDAEVRGIFDEEISLQAVHYREGFATPGQPSASWRVIKQSAPEAVAYYGGAADLLVVGRPSDEDLVMATAEAALFGSACPVLLAPPGGARHFGQRVLIGWNRTIPAQRAVAGAMPFLGLAEEVEIFSVATGATQGASPQDIAQLLAWHGIQARLRETSPDSRPVGQALLDGAREVAADLLVMGAYSHSRTRQKLLGGVTRHILAHAELPVLMAH